MNNFTAIELSQLPPPNVVEPLDYEQILAAMLADLKTRDPFFDALVESDPAYKILEVAAFRELLMRQRVNDAGRSVMLAYATGSDLDHLGALMGVARLAGDDGSRPAEAVIETDGYLPGSLIPSGYIRRRENGVLPPLEVKFVPVAFLTPPPYPMFNITVDVSGSTIILTGSPSQVGDFTPSGISDAIALHPGANALVEVIVNGFGGANIQYSHLENHTLLLMGGRDATDPYQESDSDFRRRIQLAPEAFSVAGPQGAYVFHALSAGPEVLDAYASSPEPGEVLVTIMSRFDSGEASSGLCNAVAQHLASDDIRPLTDHVTVQSVEVVDYEIVASIFTYPGPDPAPIIQAAQNALAAYISNIRKIGRDISRSGIFAALHQPGVQRVALTEPSDDVPISNLEVGNCTSITITLAGVDE
jgi:phage-related baseplate assembly protein